MTTATVPRTGTGPVPVTIAPRRPEFAEPGPLPVAINPRPIGDDEFRVTANIGVFSEALGCSCQADDDQPY
ncbi:hypothetical protein ACFYVL_27920 [Streptomyces sp. NPDC004111]|uniref:hypothetical protein n=1 Tax=Streptomyces sp. NPDC004111 TaxID=3364690 RepID=UPI003687B3D2